MTYLRPVFLLLLLFPLPSMAFEKLQALLAQDTAPVGIVIEITSGNALYLERIMPQLKKDIAALQQKFDSLPIAIVSHARESLILANKNQAKHQELHNQVKDLTSSTNTTVHVCGTYASWFNIKEDEFPDYINVSPAGPTQVNDYIDIGYEHIEL